ncbi:MAG: PGPGW domain-containing protein [Sphingopyxis sp.]|uniref:PGPGW domain-containing protein n=1 Tax=Sphingopyxis sp. TaxID=1908224 RepID=UPI002AB88D19|nr:PGPGW domain-containing protein [Sphingopyxis sp.]MDZ3830581.1 PGPGW domain-containing protein [Sphingopyxis sp.]
MRRPSLYQRLRSNAQVRFALFVAGLLLMVIAVLIGPLPGPGFLVLFPVGLMLTLQNSLWAKRRYVGFKRRHPRYGEWADRVMRRVSAARRRARRRLERALDDD